MDEKIMLSDQASELAVTILERYRNNDGKIFLVGVSGAPATGKSTLAEIIVDKLNLNGVDTQYCPMDGFHFTNQELAEMHLGCVKGKIETFDVGYFSECITSLRCDNKPFYWPIYSRKIHDPIPEGVLIRDKTKIFIVEGNYIFFNSTGWKEIKKCFDLKIFLTASDEVLEFRLLKRHLTGGKKYEIALEKIKNVDIPNAHKILECQNEADIVLDTGKIQM